MHIEIVSWRDDDNDEKLFIDGVEVSDNVAWTLIDPGAGGISIGEWRENKRWAVETASKAAGKVIADWYDQAERSVYVDKPYGPVECWHCAKKVEWDSETSDFLLVGDMASEDRGVCGGDSPDQLHMGG